MSETSRRTIVAIVATGGYAPDQHAYRRAESLLQAQGCEVRHYEDFDRRYLRFAAPDAMRIGAVHDAARDPEVEIVLALRGGYGTTRLMQQLDFPMLAASGKHFVGHSDVTAMHLGLLASGGHAFAGPMICDDFTREDVSEFTMTNFWDCVRGPAHSVVFSSGNAEPLSSDSPVEGTLWGGNLTMLVNLLGTPWFPHIKNGILFLEDINEHPFRVERMLLQLLHAGVLDSQRAILLGDFSGGRLTEYDNGYDFDAMLSLVRSRVKTPVITGLPFGHIRDKATMVLGSSAILSLDSGTGAVLLTMRDYPNLGRRGS